jgi:hypothetical protein
MQHDQHFSESLPDKPEMLLSQRLAWVLILFEESYQLFILAEG